MSQYTEPKTIRKTTINFGELHLPPEVSVALAEAFWESLPAGGERSAVLYWYYIRIFDQFCIETLAVVKPADFTTETIARYIGWLNLQILKSGASWAKSTRANAYNAIARLIRWGRLNRTNEILLRIELPYNPFPWRNRDSGTTDRVSAEVLKKILRACEKEISQTRTVLALTFREGVSQNPEIGSVQWAVARIMDEYGGIVPTKCDLKRCGDVLLAQAIATHGGMRRFELHVYPTAEAIVPYYLAILVHAAGNPDPIVELGRDCLQDIPLMDDQKALAWFKARSNSIQRRTFKDGAPFGPPVLVRELLRWSEPLRALAPAHIRDRLFLYRGVRGVTVLTSSRVKKILPKFISRHGIPRFALAAIRPSVLTSLYRATGDLHTAKAAACHANVATTVKYVQGPLVKADNAERVSALQNAFLGHITKRRKASPSRTLPRGVTKELPPQGAVVTMFGFDCKNPFAGIAPGTAVGSLCMNYMGCFTCPNAVIVPEPRVLAKLVQAKHHLLNARTSLHPARWQTFYETQLRILEEDILPRFTTAELSAAEALCSQLPSLPDLR